MAQTCSPISMLLFAKRFPTFGNIGESKPIDGGHPGHLKHLPNHINNSCTRAPHYLPPLKRKRSLTKTGSKNLLKEEQAQLARLRSLNGLFDLRGKRTTLSRSESFLSQGLTQLAPGQLDPVPRLLSQAHDAMQPVEVLLIGQMSRYTNAQKIAQWKRWVKDTVEDSRQMGGLMIVVIKASQEFRLYQNGILRQNYPANLGFSGLQDKLYEGDGATPEGIFHILQKKREGETQFHKAFMLDFPTPLQQRQFQVAKAKGLVPANRRIGGLIEIHGQWPGERDLTNGCVSIDNAIMNKLFPLVSVNTPVVIVGALDPTNSVSEALAPIHHHHLQRQSLAIPSPITLSRLSDK